MNQIDYPRGWCEDHVAEIQGFMAKRGYSRSRGPDQSGPAGPDTEALGTIRSAGRNTAAVSSHSPSVLDETGSDASTAQFQLTYFDPPKPLERYILTFFHFIWEESVIRDRHPGGLPQLFLTPRGSGCIRFGDRVDPFVGVAHMFSGFETAAPFEISGPWHSFGASLTPIGWAALTRKPASALIDRFIPAEALLGEEFPPFADALAESYRNGETTGAQACERLGEWISAHLSQVPPAHCTLVEKTLAWLGTALDPDVEALFETLAYSRRQAERLITRYFGFSPAALARRYRAIRAANLLAERSLSDEDEAELAMAFYDQPHMIREIRRYCGYTPTRLGGEAEPLFQTMLRLRNLRRVERYLPGNPDDPPA